MNREISVTTRLAATLLLVSIAAVGCAGQSRPSTGLSGDPISTPSSQVDQATPTLAPSPSDAPSESPAPVDSASAIQGGSAVATPDPLDSQLSGLDNLLNGLNSSLSSSDSGSASGE